MPIKETVNIHQLCMFFQCTECDGNNIHQVGVCLWEGNNWVPSVTLYGDDEYWCQDCNCQTTVKEVPNGN